MKKKQKKCLDCSNLISYDAVRCKECNNIKNRKNTRPSSEELKILIENNSFLKIGKMFDVSDNTIRKWAKGYGILEKK